MSSWQKACGSNRYEYTCGGAEVSGVPFCICWTTSKDQVDKGECRSRDVKSEEPDPASSWSVMLQSRSLPKIAENNGMCLKAQQGLPACSHTSYPLSELQYFFYFTRHLLFSSYISSNSSKNIYVCKNSLLWNRVDRSINNGPTF